MFEVLSVRCSTSRRRSWLLKSLKEEFTSYTLIGGSQGISVLDIAGETNGNPCEHLQCRNRAKLSWLKPSLIPPFYFGLSHSFMVEVLSVRCSTSRRRSQILKSLKEEVKDSLWELKYWLLLIMPIPETPESLLLKKEVTDSFHQIPLLFRKMS